MFSFFRKIRNKSNESDQGPVNLGTLKNSNSSKVTVKSENKVSKDVRQGKAPCTKSGTESDVTLLAEVYPCPSILPVCAEKVSTEIVSVNPESTGCIHKEDLTYDESPDEFCEALETIPAPPTNYEMLPINSEHTGNTFLERGTNDAVVKRKNRVKFIDTENSLNDCTNAVQSMPTVEYKKLQEENGFAKLSNLTRDVSPQFQLNYPSIHNR
jgi:hypothetical protein